MKRVFVCVLFITTGCASSNLPEPMKSIIEEGRKIRYHQVKPNIPIQTTVETKKNGGNCVQKAWWAYYKLKKAGYNVEFFLGFYDCEGDREHAWVVLTYKNQKYIVDITNQYQQLHHISSRCYSKVPIRITGEWKNALRDVEKKENETY